MFTNSNKSGQTDVQKVEVKPGYNVFISGGSVIRASKIILGPGVTVHTDATSCAKVDGETCIPHNSHNHYEDGVVFTGDSHHNDGDTES